MNILIIDPDGLAISPLENSPMEYGGNTISHANGILETVWRLGVERPQLVIVIQPSEPDVDWVHLSHCTCPSARIVNIPSGTRPSTETVPLHNFRQQLVALQTGLDASPA